MLANRSPVDKRCAHYILVSTGQLCSHSDVYVVLCKKLQYSWGDFLALKVQSSFNNYHEIEHCYV